MIATKVPVEKTSIRLTLRSYRTASKGSNPLLLRGEQRVHRIIKRLAPPDVLRDTQHRVRVRRIILRQRSRGRRCTLERREPGAQRRARAVQVLDRDVPGDDVRAHDQEPLLLAVRAGGERRELECASVSAGEVANVYVEGQELGGERPAGLARDELVERTEASEGRLGEREYGGSVYKWWGNW